MRRYELMLLLRPDLEDDRLQAAVEKVTRAIVNAGGSLSKVSPWGKRRLAYEIQHFREASYFLIHFDIEPVQVRGIERGLLISEEILRHMVTLIEDRGAAPDEEIPAAVPAAEADGAASEADAAGEPNEEPRASETALPNADAEAAELSAGSEEPAAGEETVAEDGDDTGTDAGAESDETATPARTEA